MLDQEALVKLGAVPSEVSVTVQKTLGDGNYGSDRAGLTITVTLNQDAKVPEVVETLEAYAKAFVAQSLKPAVAELKTHVGAAQAQAAAPVVAQSRPEPAAGEKSFIAETVVVSFKASGEAYGKVKGGNFKQYGVFAWKEPFESINVDVSKFKGGAHPAADVLGEYTRCVYTEKTTDDGKVVPDKIMAFTKPA